MKKILLFLSAIMLLASCNSTDAQLKAVAEQMNARCPQVLTPELTLKNVHFDGLMLFNYTVNEDLLPMTTVAQNIDLSAEAIKSELNSPANQMMLDLCKKAGAEIMYQYTGDQTGDMCWITYNPTTDTVVTKTSVKLPEDETEEFTEVSVEEGE